VRGWWGALPFVSRREYLRAVDLVTETLDNYDRLYAKLLRLAATRASNTLDTTAAIQEINQIKVALGHVAVYEGIVESSPVAMLVDALVRDHEELETRIDAVVHYLSAVNATMLRAGEQPVTALEISTHVVDLLKGGVRVPDTIEGI